MYTDERKLPILPNDMAQLEVATISHVMRGEVYILNDDSNVSLQENFYAVTDQKGNTKFYDRQSEKCQERQIVHFYAAKPSYALYLVSV